MGVKQTVDYDPTEEFVEEGRKALAEGRLDEARAAFEMVLRKNPQHPRALLGIAYVKRQTEPPPPGGEAVLSVEIEIVELVREKRYEEALEMLERTRLVRPDDTTVQRSIVHIRGHLDRKWRKALGGDDAMVALLQPSDHPLAQHMPAPLGEILEASGDSFETLRMLIDWRGRGLLRDRDSIFPPMGPVPAGTGRDAPVKFRSGAHDQAEPPIMPPEPKRDRTGTTFVGVLLVLVLGIAALWWVTRGEVPTPEDVSPRIESPAPPEG